MRIVSIVLSTCLILVSIGVASADVYVDGYYRSDGTYVQPHVRSSPDGQRWNNYGPSQSPSDRFNPSLRDYDNDGLSNQYDMDSDNDGYFDNFDSNPYGQ